MSTSAMTQSDVEAASILVVQAGSHLYGTSTPESDEDYLGVFLPDAAHVLGLGRVEQMNASIESKRQDGRNAPDAVDFTYHSLEKFCREAMKGAPNFLEVLFAPESAIVSATDAGRELLAARDLFPYLNGYKRFLGYAQAQRKKMVLRSTERGELQRAAETLRAIADQVQESGERLTMNDLRYLSKGPDKRFDLKGVAFNEHFARLGSINVEYHHKVGTAARMAEERLAKATARSELMDRYGFDAKFGAHLIRLLLECRNLIRDGEIVMPLPYADHLLDIRTGGRDMMSVDNEADEIIAEIEALVESNPRGLPRKPRYAAIDALVQRLTYERVMATYVPG